MIHTLHAIKILFHNMPLFPEIFNMIKFKNNKRNQNQNQKTSSIKNQIIFLNFKVC